MSNLCRNSVTWNTPAIWLGDYDRNAWLVTKEADRIDIPVEDRPTHHYQWRSCHEHARIRFETERRGWGRLRIPSRWSLDISWPGIDRHNWSASAAPIRRTTMLFHCVWYGYDELRTTSTTGGTRPRWLCELDSTSSTNRLVGGSTFRLFGIFTIFSWFSSTISWIAEQRVLFRDFSRLWNFLICDLEVWLGYSWVFLRPRVVWVFRLLLRYYTCCLTELCDVEIMYLLVYLEVLFLGPCVVWVFRLLFGYCVCCILELCDIEVMFILAIWRLCSCVFVLFG